MTLGKPEGTMKNSHDEKIDLSDRLLEIKERFSKSGTIKANDIVWLINIIDKTANKSVPNEKLT